MTTAQTNVIDTDFSDIDFSGIDMLDIQIVETSGLAGLPETGASCCGAAEYQTVSCSSCCVVFE